MAVQQHRILPASTIVQRVSGKKRCATSSAENIFAPLEMTHTHSATSLRADCHRALAYDEQENHGGYTLNVSYFEQTGDGAVHTSVEDLLKWDENFYSPARGRQDSRGIQGARQVDDGKVLEYAKGLFLQDYRGLHTVSHGGSGRVSRGAVRFPDQHFSVASL